MKKLFFLLLISMSFLTACEKEDEQELPCPVVESKSIPASVTNSFRLKYPDQVVIRWFNKDNTGFAAYLLNNGVKTLALFANNGSFIKTEVKVNQHDDDDDDEDEDDEEEGCDCEID